MRSQPITLIRLFALAAALRWAYAFVCYGALGNDGLMSADSYGYLQHAQEFADQIRAGAVPGWEWLGRDLEIMPMYTWLVTLNVFLAGKLAPLATVLMQGLLDAGTCLLVYGIATAIAPQFALAAGIAAALNPTQIVLSGLLYNDTLFVFFVALSFLGVLHWWQKPTWSLAFLTGVALAAAAMTRVLVVLWTPCLLLFLLVALAATRRLARQHLVQFVAIGAIVLIGIAPVVTRNVVQYGAWELTPQGGAHLALWVVPLIKEGQDGTPWPDGSKAMEAEMRQRYPTQDSNTFVEARHYEDFGRDKLRSFGLAAIAKAWLTGAVINLAAPAGVMSPLVSKLPRTGFYETRGDTTPQKIWNFLFHSDNALYSWIALAGLAGLAVFRLLQLAGAVALLRQPGAMAFIILFGPWIGFILVINGPVASAKYRLPIEPALALLTGAGASACRRQWKPRSLRPAL